MRPLLIILIIAGLSVLYLWQRNHEARGGEAKNLTTRAATSEATPALTPAREVSEHNWMKRSLDRARDVTQQTRAQTKQGQDP